MHFPYTVLLIYYCPVLECVRECVCVVLTVCGVTMAESRNHIMRLRSGGGLHVRRSHRPLRATKGHRTRGSVWLQSPLMGLTAEDSRHSVSREEPEAHISASSSIDGSRSDDDSSSVKSNTDSSWESATSGRQELLQQQQEQCRRLLLLKRREGLIDITLRTVNLIRRNQQLQHRLAALQAETRAFVRSVLNNPENQGIKELAARSVLLQKNKRIKSEDEEDNNIVIKKAKSQDLRVNEKDSGISESSSCKEDDDYECQK